MVEKIVYGWRWAGSEGGAKIHASNELENKMDKKSVRVTLNNADRDVVEFKGYDSVSYDFQIGEHNGCLLIVKKQAVTSVISVPDEEDIYQAYGCNGWLEAELV